MQSIAFTLISVLLAVRSWVLIGNMNRFSAARKMCAEINARSYASDPGTVEMSDRALRRLRPDWYNGGLDPFAWLDLKYGGRAMARFLVADQLEHGDSRAALVVSVNPLLVAAYTDELDCIALLRFPDELVEIFSLEVGRRLITVNRYQMPAEPVARDLAHGPASLHN